MINEEMDFETDQVEHLPDSETVSTDSLVNYVTQKFRKAEDKKAADETRALLAYNNFRGVYGPDTQFTQAEKSRVFVKITKTKVQAAYGQIIQVLFGNGKFPLTIDQTTLPDGVIDEVSFDPNAPPAPPTQQKASPFGTRDETLPPGATLWDMEKLGPMAEKLAPVQDRLVAGPGTTSTAVTFHPAHVAAKRMEKKIHDQLDESNGNKHLRGAAFEMALFGTGILKGPMALDKEYSKWDDDGNYNPLIKTIPTINHVSFWNFYPDPDALNMDEVEWVIERHKLSRTQLKALNQRPFFRKKEIDEVIELGPNYSYKYWETAMIDGTTDDNMGRWEALEYWGFIPVKELREHDIPVPRTYKDDDELNVNVWVCNGSVIRLVMNPFKPARIPYYAAPYELNPYGFFGVGVAENMEDTQLLMNGFMRMAVDNQALSGNLVFEVDEQYLTAGQNDLEIWPGKVFSRQSGVPGQAIFAHEFPNVSQQNMQLFDKARMLSDEATGIPSFSHGQTGVSGVGRTASGISMLMDAANGGIRTVVTNLDDYLIGPLGRALFAFNMQFDFDPTIKGDLEVNARATESLVAKEVMSQRLLQFLQVTATNPMLAPFVKLDVLVREIAKTLDIDPDRITNSLPDAVLQAEVLKQFSAAMEQPQGGAEGGAPAGLDTSSGPGSGGGTMGTSAPPAPGAPGFSGNSGNNGGNPQPAPVQ